MRVRSRFVSRLLLFVMFTLMAAVVIPVASAPQASADATNCATVTTISSAECLALVAFYDSTSGVGWTTSTNWKQDDPCAWQGVTCAGAQVTILNLGSNALSGPIPSSIGNLTGLTSLRLHRNGLSGPIPSQIGLLTGLTGLGLDNNALSGEVPSSIPNLINLANLYLNPNGCLWASYAVTTFVTGAADTGGSNGAALDDACKPPPVVCGALCEGVTVLEGPNECGVVKVQVPSGLMGLLDLSVPVSVDTNPVVFDGLLPSDGIISFTYPDGFGPVFTFGATLLNGGYGGNYTSTVTILAPTTAPAAGCEPATETETAETETAPETDAVAAVAAPVLAFTGTGSGLTQLALAITGAGALMMTVSRRRR